MKTILIIIVSILTLCGAFGQEINPYKPERKGRKMIRKVEAKELRKLARKARLRLNDTLAVDYEEIQIPDLVVTDHRGKRIRHKKPRVFRSRSGIIALTDSGITGFENAVQITDTGTVAMPDTIRMTEESEGHTHYGTGFSFDFTALNNPIPLPVLGQRPAGLMVCDSTFCSRYVSNDLLLAHVAVGIAAYRATYMLMSVDMMMPEIRIERGVGRNYSRTNSSQTALWLFGIAMQNENQYDYKLLASGRNFGGLANISTMGRANGKTTNVAVCGGSHISSFFAYCVTHEVGHLCGADHTHECRWILPDGRVGRLDSCESGPIGGYTCGFVRRRNDNGHFMSYCHNNGRINMSRMIPQITQRIRNTIVSSTVPGSRILCTQYTYTNLTACTTVDPNTSFGMQTRRATCLTPIGGEGIPGLPLFLSCRIPCTQKNRGPWGPCIVTPPATVGFQSRTITGVPAGCPIGWPADTLTRSCTLVVQPPPPPVSALIPYTITSTTGTTHAGVVANIQDGDTLTRWVSRGPSAINLTLARTYMVDTVIIQSGFFENRTWTKPIASIRVTVGARVINITGNTQFQRKIAVGASGSAVRVEGLDTDFNRFVNIFVKGK